MARTIHQTFAAIDEQDADAFVAGLSPDVTFTFGNNPPARGREEVRAAVRQFWASIGGLRHEVLALWDPEPDVSIAEMRVYYTRLDGGSVDVPCVDVLRWEGDLVADWRILIDLTPVYAPATTSTASGV